MHILFSSLVFQYADQRRACHPDGVQDGRQGCHHVDKDGKLVVGTDKKVNKAVSVEKGFKDGTTEAGQGNIVSADNTVGKNLTALDTAIAANKHCLVNTSDAADDKDNLDTA